MSGLISAVLVLALIALATAASFWYFKQLRKDRADPVINPGGTIDVRHATSLFHDPSDGAHRDSGDAR
jgi:hypothetical protein